MTTPTTDRNLMTLLVSPFERGLLDAICEQEGGASRSAVMRKMIKQEADRRNIDVSAVASTLTAGQPAQAS